MRRARYAAWRKPLESDPGTNCPSRRQSYWHSPTSKTGSTHSSATATSTRLSAAPRDARAFDQRTDEALAFLADSNLPIEVLRVVVYEDQEHRRFIDIEGDNDPVFDEPPLVSESFSSGPVHLKINGRRIQLSDPGRSRATHCWWGPHLEPPQDRGGLLRCRDRYGGTQAS